MGDQVKPVLERALYNETYGGPAHEHFSQTELERFVGSLRILGLCEVLPSDAGDRGEREDGEPCVSCPGIRELQQLDPPTSTLSQGTRGEILSQVWYQSKNLSTVCAKYK